MMKVNLRTRTPIESQAGMMRKIALETLQVAIAFFSLFFFVILFSSIFTSNARAAQSGSKSSPSPRDVEVDSVKDAYWNRTSNGDLEVVQNRQYSKAGKFSLQAGVSTVASDPFLSIRGAGGSVGYHLTESFGIFATARKYFVSNSSYYGDLQSGLITGLPSPANTNHPNAFYGGELEYTPFYGKLSLSGTSIVHFDVHFLAGLGITQTDSGNDLTPTIGVGPQIYLTQALALRLDYRLGVYRETIPETVQTSPSIAGYRTNFSHQFMIGFEVLL